MALPARHAPISTIAPVGARARPIPPPPPVPRASTQRPPPIPRRAPDDALAREVRQLRADLDLVLDATGRRLDAVDDKSEALERHTRRQHERIRELERQTSSTHQRMKVLAKKLLALVSEVRSGKAGRLEELERAIAHLEEDVMQLDRRVR